MISRFEDATVPVRAVLATVVGAVLALLLPSLSGTADTSATVTLALLALAVAALAGSATRLGVVLAGSHAAVPPTCDDAPPVLPGRVTDPVHHPLRPRAPGLA